MTRKPLNFYAQPSARRLQHLIEGGPRAMFQLIAPMLTMNGVLFGIVLCIGWLVHSTRRQARRDEQSMANATHSAEVQLLLRGVPPSSHLG